MNTPTDMIRLRAVFVGLFLAVIICAVTPYNNTYLQATPLGGGHFPLAPFFIFFWLALLTAGTGRVFRRTFFSAKELLLIWMLMVLVSGIAYTGLVRTFFVNLTVPFHFATAGNAWETTLQPLLPRSWYPRSAAAVELFYNGLDGGRHMGWWQVLTSIPWQAWIIPLGVWASFIFLAYGVMICLVNLLSRQWIHNERMNFPLLRVPQLMADAFEEAALGKFLKDRYLLTGIALPVLLHLMNGLNFYFPEFPQMPTLILAGSYFPKHGLFSGFNKLKIYIYPAFIGFAFLASRQISFSFWFFFLSGGLLFGLLSVLGYNIPAAALGTTFGPTLSRPEEMQMIGAYLVFFGFIVWLARYHLIHVFRRATGRAPGPDAETEWISVKTAFWGVAAGTLGIVAWMCFFGMPMMAAMAVVAVFFIFMLVASRVICQGGLAYFTLTAAPIDALVAFLGPQFFTKVGMLMAAVVQKVLFQDLRESLMPSLVHASSITHRIRNKRRIFGGMLITLTAGVVVSFAAMLSLCYKYGARELQLDWATRTTTAVYTSVQTLVESPFHGGDWVLIFAVAGAVVMLTLVICYHRFYWWPIHPVGYLTTYSSAMRILWVSFFIGWLCNALCMRYGGVLLFKRLRLFFIGLVIGDFLMGGIWALIGLFGDASYQVLPT